MNINDLVKEYVELIDTTQDNTINVDTKEDKVIDFGELKKILNDFSLKVNEKLENTDQHLYINDNSENVSLILPNGELKFGKWEGNNKVFADYTNAIYEERNNSMYIRHTGKLYVIIDDCGSYDKPLNITEDLEEAVIYVLRVLLLYR